MLLDLDWPDPILRRLGTCAHPLQTMCAFEYPLKLYYNENRF